MVNLFIIFVFILNFTLLAIFYGILPILAIILSSLALIPFVMSTCLYFIKRPRIHYTISSKNSAKEGEKFIYDTWFTIDCQKGQVLLSDLFITSESGVIPVKHPSYIGNFQYAPILEKDGFITTAQINVNDKPFFEKNNFGYLLRFESKEDKAQITVKFVIDTKIDPMKLGYMSIFQPNHNYRYLLKTTIDFSDAERQEGFLKNY